MWDEAAKWLKKYSEGVITGVDKDGYPVSARQTSLVFDAASGTMPVVGLANLGAVEGPANLLCHFHDDKLWNMHAIQIRGRLERRGTEFMFVATGFTPPSMLKMIRGMHASAKAYVEKRGLPKPIVNFDAVNALWERARKVENP